MSKHRTGFELARREALIAASTWALAARAASAPRLPLTAATPPEITPAQPPLQFPRDHGTHLDARTEWWYITGQLQAATPPPTNTATTANTPALPQPLGFQITFFRSRIEAAQTNPSALAARHLIMAHVALSDVAQGRQWHEQRLARAALGLSDAATTDTNVHLRDWRLQRQSGTETGSEGSRYRADVQARDFGLQLNLSTTQAVMPQGDAGLSHKGPLPQHVSHYYSQPQLAVQGTLTRGGKPLAVTGRAWLDHEWSDAYLPPGAIGWDWIGMNLSDGGALMAFRMRRADGSTLWAGGSFRAPGQATRSFAAHEVSLQPGKVWQSPATGARYPMQWWVQTPVGRFEVLARFEAQELNAQQSTGTVYWEGLSTLRDAQHREVGTGYLEMTGYAGALAL